MLSIVIPTLNAEKDLPATLRALGKPTVPVELVVADGGSADATARIAADAGARLLTAPPGRGTQMAAGAAAATGDWLLFLHADTRPEPGWDTALRVFMAADDNQFRAAYFRFRLDDVSPQARRVEKFVHFRCRQLKLPYGDQGLVMSRQFYDLLGGFKPIPLMEDVDMAKRIGGARLTPLHVAAVTSARRYREEGYWLRPIRNLVCVGLFFLGMPVNSIKAFYG